MSEKEGRAIRNSSRDTSSPARCSTLPPYSSKQPPLRDVFDAFELASPGSANLPFTDDEMLASPVQRTLEEQSLGKSEGSLLKETLSSCRTPCIDGKLSFAARMGKARRLLKRADADAEEKNVHINRDKDALTLPLSTNQDQPSSGETRQIAILAQDTNRAKGSSCRIGSPCRTTRAYSGPNGGDVKSQPIFDSPISLNRRPHRALTLSPSHSLDQPEISSPSRYKRRMLDSPSAASKKTYGGPTRSHLAEVTMSVSSHQGSTSGIAEDLMGTVEARAPAQESYAELRQKWVIEDGCLEYANQTSCPSSLHPLKSLTSLRSQGSLKRFADELDFLLEGLQPSKPLSARRASGLELLKKLCGASDSSEEEGSESGYAADVNLGAKDPEKSVSSVEPSFFLRQLKASDALIRLWDAWRRAGAGDGNDVVLDWSLSIALGQLTHPGVFGARLLEHRGDDVWHSIRKIIRAAAIRAAEQGLTSNHQARRQRATEDQHRADLEVLARKTEPASCHAVERPTPLVSILASLCCICQLPPDLQWDPATAIVPRQLTEGSKRCIDDVQDSGASLLQLCAQRLRLETARASSRLEGFVQGLDLWPPLTSPFPGDGPQRQSGVPSVSVLQLLSPLFETAMEILTTSGKTAEQGDVTSVLATVETVPRLAHDIVTCVRFAVVAGAESSKQMDLHSCQQLLETISGWLKVLIISTQGNAGWCEAILAADDTLSLVVRLVVEFGRATLWPHMIHSPGEGGKAPRANISHAASATTSAMPGPAMLQQDIFCLSLALLTNLLEHGSTAALQLADVRIPGVASSRCERKRCRARYGCEQSCVGVEPALVALFRLLVDPLPRDKDDTGADSYQDAPESSGGTDFMRGSIALAVGLALNRCESNLEVLLEPQPPTEAPLLLLAEMLEALTCEDGEAWYDAPALAKGDTGVGSDASRTPTWGQGDDNDVVSTMARRLRQIHSEIQ